MDKIEQNDIFTCVDMTSSQWGYCFYQFFTTWYMHTTNFYIIKHVLVSLEIMDRNVPSLLFY